MLMIENKVIRKEKGTSFVLNLLNLNFKVKFSEINIVQNE